MNPSQPTNSLLLHRMWRSWTARLVGLGAARVNRPTCPSLEDGPGEDWAKRRRRLIWGWLDHPVGSCPWRAGDELIGREDDPKRNILHDIIERDRQDLFERALQMGLSPFIAPFPDAQNHALGWKKGWDGDFSLSSSPYNQPILDVFRNDRADFLTLCIEKDTSGLCVANNPHICFWLHSLYQQSLDCFLILLQKKWGLTPSGRVLHGPYKIWNPAGGAESGVDLIDITCQISGFCLPDFLEALRRHGLDVRKRLAEDAEQGNMILRKAILQANAKKIHTLSLWGCNVNGHTRPGPEMGPMTTAWPPLMLAAFQPNPDVVDALLEHGASWNGGGGDIWVSVEKWREAAGRWHGGFGGKSFLDEFDRSYQRAKSHHDAFVQHKKLSEICQEEHDKHQGGSGRKM